MIFANKIWVQLSAPKKDTHTTFSTSSQELISQADVDVQHVGKELQELSFASDSSVTTLNFNLVSKKISQYLLNEVGSSSINFVSCK